MPQESSPHVGSSRFQGRIQACKDGWRAAGLHLDNFRAAQLGFVLPLVLPAADRNSSSAKPLPPNLQGFKFGGLGLRWVVLSNALTATANPSPPNLKPRQTRHHSHAS